MLLDQVDLIREFNGILIGPHHGIRVADGVVHPTNAGYLHQAALEAICRREVGLGNGWNLLPPVSVARSGDTITIPISTRAGESLRLLTGKYAAYGGDPANLGLEAVGGGTITGASVSGSNIVVQVSGTITAIRYAHQRNDSVDYGVAPYVDANGEAYSAKRGIIAGTHEWAENFAGHSLTVQRHLPTFEVTVT